MSFRPDSDESPILAFRGNDVWAPAGLALISLDLSYLPQVCSLEKRCYSHPWSDTLIAGEFSKNVSLRLGLVQDNYLVGYSFSYLVGDELHILNLAIRPEMQGRGLGRRLLKGLLTSAYDRGVRFATLEVRQSNTAARSLYERVGFVLTGIRKNYYRNNHEDALVHELVLSGESIQSIRERS